MSVRRWLLLIFSIIVAAACLSLPFLPESQQPFNIVGGPNSLSVQIAAGSSDIPMPEGLLAGDLMYFTDMSPDTRSYFEISSINPPVGTVIDLPVRRADGVHHIEAKFLPASFLSGGVGNILNTLASYALTLLMAALGLLLLWRGNSQATLGVALWCIAEVAEAVSLVLPIPMPYCKLLAMGGTIFYNTGTLVGLYLVADFLTASARTQRRRLLTTLGFIAIILFYVAEVLSFSISFYLNGLNPGAGALIVVSVHIAAFAIPLAIMIFSYRRSDAVNQARIRWVMFGLAGLVLGYILGILGGRISAGAVTINLIGDLLTAATFTAFSYAVLKHRLVSLQFVLNRALVYGLITSLVVGVFAAMLTFLEHETLNTGTNRLLTLVVPLLLGMGLNTLKRNVDEYINKIFFRHRHRAEEALAQFARTCGYVEDPEKLLDLTADELYRHGGAESLAIYLTEPNKAGAKLVRQRGADGAYTQHLDIDDLGFLRLRAGDLEIDLHGIASGLGQEGNVYAFTVRGDVMGFIVCGARPAEAYSPEERRLFALVAHQVAVALHSLRMEEEHRLLKALAEGSFKSLPTAQAKAKELIRAAN